jgi:putative transposase
MATQLKPLFREFAAQDGFEIVADDALRLPDHVHLFVSVPPQFAPAQVVPLFKGITSRHLAQEFAQIRRVYWGPNATLWAEGHSRASINRCSATSQ